MSNNIEIEGKILVQKNEFDKLLKYFNLNADDKIMQTNHYIDSKDQILRSFGFALRIRELDNDFVLTLKTPLSEGLLEKDQEVTKEQYETLKTKKIFPEGDIKQFLLMLGIDVKKLLILTSLTTERYNVNYHDGLLSLDKNFYNGLIDYEVELEDSSLENAHKNLRELCQEVGIEYQLNDMSKQHRAIASL